MSTRSGYGMLVGAALLTAVAGGLSGCSEDYPEVVVVHRAGQDLLLRNPSYSGCVWDVVLALGEATWPARCLPGADRVHFGKLEIDQAGAQQDDAGSIPSSPGSAGEQPLWFSYQTITSYDAGYGDFMVLDITAEDMEQDFSVPGPYGH